jgi:hypothetical protein
MEEQGNTYSSLPGLSGLNITFTLPHVVGDPII